MMLTTLARASLDGALLVAAIWIVIRLVPRLSPATRTLLWWCAAAKFVVALVWLAPIPVRILPPVEPPIERAMAMVEPPAAHAGSVQPSSPSPAAKGVDANSPARAWAAVLLAAWTIGVGVTTAVAVRRWRRMRALVTRAAAAPPAIRILAADIAARLGLRRVPDVRISEEAGTPLVAGLLRPVVVLPAPRFPVLTDRQQQMALCHELAHVRRADLWLGCVPAIAERAFFFHPLVHAAVREYALWREAACDAAVLNALDASPHEYGRLLLDLGLSRRTAGPVAAGAPWSFTNLKRRIAMLGAPSTRSIGSRLIAATVVTLSAAAIAPLTLAARPSSRTASAPPAAGAVSSPEPTERSREQEKQEKQEKQERRLNFVMFLDEDTTTMSGDIQDIKRAKRFKRPGERMLWFRQADREYVVRDPEMLRQIEAIWRPVSEIGERQGTIGAKQGKLGARQGALGAEQGEIGARQAAIGAVQGRIGERQAEVGARQAALAEREARRQTAAQRDAIEQARRALEQQMRELDREIAQLDVKMRELEKPMDDLGQQMDALGRQMDVLGREMDVLGRQMDEAVREAEAAMREILDRAVATGAAELVR